MHDWRLSRVEHIESLEHRQSYLAHYIFWEASACLDKLIQ
jgi:hypothetical protein